MLAQCSSCASRVINPPWIFPRATWQFRRGRRYQLAFTEAMTLVSGRTIGVVTAIALLLSVGWVSLVSGYKLEFSESTPLYEKWENVPFDQMRVLRNIGPGEQVSAVRCVDISSDLYFEVATVDGWRGVMYSTNFVATKEAFWSLPAEWGTAFLHPLDALACVSLLPPFSDRTRDKQRSK